MKKIARLMVVLSVLVTCVGWPSSVRGAELPKNIALKDLKGETVLPSELYKDKVAVLVFWATWCIPCKKQLPELDKFLKELNNPDFQVIAISTDTTRDLSKVRPYVNTRKFGYPVLLDTESSLAKILNPRGILPYTAILDKKGSIVYEKSGYRSGDLNTIQSKVRELLDAAGKDAGAAASEPASSEERNETP